MVYNLKMDITLSYKGDNMLYNPETNTTMSYQVIVQFIN